MLLKCRHTGRLNRQLISYDVKMQMTLAFYMSHNWDKNHKDQYLMWEILFRLFSFRCSKQTKDLPTRKKNKEYQIYDAIVLLSSTQVKIYSIFDISKIKKTLLPLI